MTYFTIRIVLDPSKFCEKQKTNYDDTILRYSNDCTGKYIHPYNEESSNLRINTKKIGYLAVVSLLTDLQDEIEKLKSLPTSFNIRYGMVNIKNNLQHLINYSREGFHFLVNTNPKVLNFVLTKK